MIAYPFAEMHPSGYICSQMQQKCEQKMHACKMQRVPAAASRLSRRKYAFNTATALYCNKALIFPEFRNANKTSLRFYCKSTGLFDEYGREQNIPPERRSRASPRRICIKSNFQDSRGSAGFSEKAAAEDMHIPVLIKLLQHSIHAPSAEPQPLGQFP